MLLEIISEKPEQFAQIERFIEENALLLDCCIFYKSPFFFRFLTRINHAKKCKRMKRLAIEADFEAHWHQNNYNYNKYK